MSIRLEANILQKSYMNLSLEEIHRIVKQVMSGVSQVSSYHTPEELHEPVTGGDSQDGEASDEQCQSGWSPHFVVLTFSVTF